MQVVYVYIQVCTGVRQIVHKEKEGRAGILHTAVSDRESEREEETVRLNEFFKKGEEVSLSNLKGRQA